KAKCALIALATWALASGCFWHSYPERMRTHTELLVEFARKGRDLVATGRFRAESLAELTYPLERASAFAAEARRHAAAPPPSLAAFERLVDRYRVFVDRLDRSRRDDAAEAAAALAQPLADVEAAAHDVTAALARERDGAAVSSGAAG